MAHGGRPSEAGQAARRTGVTFEICEVAVLAEGTGVDAGSSAEVVGHSEQRLTRQTSSAAAASGAHVGTQSALLRQGRRVLSRVAACGTGSDAYLFVVLHSSRRVALGAGSQSGAEAECAA